MRRYATGLIAGLALLVLGGCSGGNGYTLPVLAVDSIISDVMIVGPSDVNLSGNPIAGVDIRIWRDPDTLGRKLIAQGRTRSDGSLDLPISAFGAGWMKEVWLVQAIRVGYESAEAQIALPKKKKGERVLIMLREGTSFTPMDASERDLDDFERFR